MRSRRRKKGAQKGPEKGYWGCGGAQQGSTPIFPPSTARGAQSWGMGSQRG